MKNKLYLRCLKLSNLFWLLHICKWMNIKNLCSNVIAKVCCSILPELLLLSIKTELWKMKSLGDRVGGEGGIPSLHLWFLPEGEQEMTSACKGRLIQVLLIGHVTWQGLIGGWIFQVILATLWAPIKVLGNYDDIRRRELVKTFVLVPSAVFTQQHSVTQVVRNVSRMQYLDSPGCLPVRAMHKSLKQSPVKLLPGPRGCSTGCTNTQQMSGGCREIALHIGVANIQHSTLTIAQVFVYSWTCS